MYSKLSWKKEISKIKVSYLGICISIYPLYLFPSIAPSENRERRKSFELFLMENIFLPMPGTTYIRWYLINRCARTEQYLFLDLLAVSSRKPSKPGSKVIPVQRLRLIYDCTRILYFFLSLYDLFEIYVLNWTIWPV